MSSSSAEDIATSASRLIEREGGFVPFVQNVGLGGIWYAFVLQVIETIQGAGLVIFGPVRALGRGLIFLVDMTFVNLISVFDAGTQASVESFADGTAALLGPFAQPFSVGVMMLSLAVFILALNRLSISPLSFLQSLRR